MSQPTPVRRRDLSVRTADGVRLPLLSVGIADDRWSTPAAVSAVLRRFPNADVTTVRPAS